MGKSTDILHIPEALPGLGIHGVVFHNGKGYYYTCKEYCSTLEKRTYECLKPDCKGTANVGGPGSSMVEISRHNHAPDYTYRNKCVVFHLIQQRFIQEHGSPVDILHDILASLAETPDADADSNCQEAVVARSTNDVKLSPVTSRVQLEESRTSSQQSLGRADSSGCLASETLPQSSENPETPVTLLRETDDCSVPAENDDNCSDNECEAESTESSANFIPTTQTAPAQSVCSERRKSCRLRSVKKTATVEGQPSCQPATNQTPPSGSEPADGIEIETCSSDGNLDAQDDDSFESDSELDADPEYTPPSKIKKVDESSSAFVISQEAVEDADNNEENGNHLDHKQKKCKELEASQQNESDTLQPIFIEDFKSEVEITDTTGISLGEPSMSANEAKELPTLLSVLGLDQLVDDQLQYDEICNPENDQGHNKTVKNPRKKRKNKMVRRNRHTWSREEEIRAAIAEGKNKFGQIEFFISFKDKINLISNGYIYSHRYDRVDGQSKWVCTNMNKCYCSLELSPDLIVLREGQHHCSKRGNVEIEIKKAYNVIKSRVLKESTKVATIYKEELVKLKERGIVVPSGYLHHSTFYDYRKKFKKSQAMDLNKTNQEAKGRAARKCKSPQNCQKEYQPIESVFLNEFTESDNDNLTPTVECSKLIKVEECFVMGNANWNELEETAHGQLSGSSNTPPSRHTHTTSSTADLQQRSFAGENEYKRFMHL